MAAANFSSLVRRHWGLRLLFTGVCPRPAGRLSVAVEVTPVPPVQPLGGGRLDVLKGSPGPAAGVVDPGWSDAAQSNRIIWLSGLGCSGPNCLTPIYVDEAPGEARLLPPGDAEVAPSEPSGVERHSFFDRVEG
jgi:hypothetical protein